jgi:hypothetical protein
VMGRLRPEMLEASWHALAGGYAAGVERGTKSVVS